MRAGAAVLLALAAAACSPGQKTEDGTDVASVVGVASHTQVSCALNGAKAFKGDCILSAEAAPDGEAWVIHHPDGGFRRFTVTDKGSRIVTADGADNVVVSQVGGDLELRVADDRYRIPS